MDNAYVNEDIIDALLKNHAKYISTACRMCRDHHKAEDIVQEAYIKTLRCLRNTDGLQSYMFLAIKTAWIDQQRQRSRHITETEASTLALEAGKRIVHNAPDDQELSDEIQEALDEIDHTTADMMLDAADGMQIKDISEKYAIGGSAITTRFHRARRKISQLLAAANPDQYGPYLR